MKFQINKIGISAGCDYSVLASWGASVVPQVAEVYVGIMDHYTESKLSEFEDLQKKVHSYPGVTCVILRENLKVYGHSDGILWKETGMDFEFEKTILEASNKFLSESEDEVDEKLKIEAIVTSFSQKLIEQIYKNPDCLDHLEWRDIERIFAEVFKGLGFNVALTPPSKDGGKDIVISIKLNGKDVFYAIELKHWKKGKVGEKEIKYFIKVVKAQEFSGGLFLSTYGFTKAVREYEINYCEKRIKLGQKKEMVKLCNLYMKNKGLYKDLNLLSAICS